jgi:hypothetical protein
MRAIMKMAPHFTVELLDGVPIDMAEFPLEWLKEG